MTQSEGDCYVFGDFRLDATEKVLLFEGKPVDLPPKALEMLLVLVRKAGHVVNKNELMATIWPDVFVEEGNLSQYVFLVRKALGTQPNGESYIETVPRRGYRFVAPVSHPERTEQTAVSASRAGLHLRWAWAVGAALVLVVSAGFGFNAWQRRSPLPSTSQWMRVTEFPDSVSSPALSPDGRLLTFLRGPGTFTTTGQVWLKSLPDGDAVQLTDDPHVKMGPVFSPDGSRIAYTVPWDTWDVPVVGGEPRLWLPNASGLTWIGDGRILFSEIKSGLHMAVVSSAENRAQARDVYVPAETTMMAHRSVLSPDGNWALIAEMETAPLAWLPCRLVSLRGASPDRQVGPPQSRCTSAAWSPDGRMMYFTADAGSGPHVWCQPFPDGAAEQITFGPTEEEGVAMAPDGRSLISAVGISQNTVWVHDAGAERRLSSEGDSSRPRFSPDGSTVYYMKRRTMVTGETAAAGGIEAGELWRVDVETGRSERMLPGFDIHSYELSADGRRVVFSTQNDGTSTLWVAPLDRGAPPRELASSESFRRRAARLVGRHLFFLEEEDGGLVSIHRLHIDDGTREEIVPGRKRCAGPVARRAMGDRGSHIRFGTINRIGGVPGRRRCARPDLRLDLQRQVGCDRQLLLSVVPQRGRRGDRQDVRRPPDERPDAARSSAIGPALEGAGGKPGRLVHDRTGRHRSRPDS